jgi:predicted DNA-binding protein (MmcQ/YjbR family)
VSERALNGLAEALRRHALAYPEAAEEHPWEQSAFKVRGKTFLFMTELPEGLTLSLKLPGSRDMANSLPFAEPTGYGLGKSGWITASVRLDTEVPTEVLMDWIDESYRAIAPKKLVAQLGAVS